MLSRSAFVFCSLTLGAITVAALVLHAAFAQIIQDETAASIITALVVAFGLGGLGVACLVYFGARIRSTVAEAVKIQPPHKIYLGPALPISPAAAPVAHAVEAPTPIVYVQNGVARLLDEPSRKNRSAVVEWAEYDPKTGRNIYRAVDVATLRRFARCHTPCRAEFTGKSTTYTLCLSFFRFQGWVRAANAGRGVVWAPPFTTVQKRLAYLGDTAALANLPQPQRQRLPLPN
jgi:hypothetical protein